MSSSIYRFWTTNLLTGQVTADWIPLVVTSMSMTLCGVGTLTGYLRLQSKPANNLPWLQALQARKTVLWCSQDGAPIWCGILWDKPHQSALSRQLPIQAKTVESLFAKRLITGALVINSTDILQIARDLIAYGTSTSLGQNTQIAGLQISVANAGVLDSWTFGTSDVIAAGVDDYFGNFSDYQATGDALSNLSTSDGFEFSFAPVAAGSAGAIMLRLGYPHLGAPQPYWTLQCPGNAGDYSYPEMGSQSANQLIGMSTANGAATTYTGIATDQPDLDAGAPLLQQYVTWPGQGIASQAQIDSYVQNLLPAYTAGTIAPTVTMRAGQSPLVRQIGLGDALQLAATSELHPAGPDGSPGLQLAARLTGWTLTPPAEKQMEKTVLQLGQLAGYVSTQVA
jgi:hypothetical protein